MEVFVVSHSLVWLAVVGYVGWLGVRQRRLFRIVDALESQLDEGEAANSGRADSAARSLPELRRKKDFK